MNGRIKREDGIAWRNPSDSRPGMYETWQDAARRLGSVVGAWGCLCWFGSMFVRGSEVGAWEIAGLVAGLIAVSMVAGRPGR